MPPFRLVPFAPDPLVSGLVLTGAVDRDGSILRATYRLAGDRSAVLIPAPVPAPARRDGLWRATCFELFVSPREQPRYLEVNLSPSTDWNVYSFTSYREGLFPLPVVRFLARNLGSGPAALDLAFELDLGPDWPPLLDAAATAVLAHSSGAKSYWALTHTHDRPDFHRRDSFLLRF